jgi:hypothetical protein
MGAGLGWGRLAFTRKIIAYPIHLARGVDGMSDQESSFQDWLIKKQLDELSIQFRAVWDLYVKFYTVFLTFTIASLGATIKYIDGPWAKAVIGLCFIAQNIVSGITAFRIAHYSLRTKGKAEDLAGAGGQISGEELHSSVKTSTIPGELGYWAGMANVIVHALFVLLWAAVSVVDIGD